MATTTHKPDAHQMVTLLTALSAEKEKLTDLIDRNTASGHYGTADFFKVTLNDINALYDMFSGAVTIEIVKRTW